MTSAPVNFSFTSRSTEVDLLSDNDLIDMFKEDYDNIESLFKCPITGMFMHDPSVTSDEHMYEYQTLSEHIVIDNRSPLTRQPLTSSSIKKVPLFKELTKIFIQLSSQFEDVEDLVYEPSNSFEDNISNVFNYLFAKKECNLMLFNKFNLKTKYKNHTLLSVLNTQTQNRLVYMHVLNNSTLDKDTISRVLEHVLVKRPLPLIKSTLKLLKSEYNYKLNALNIEHILINVILNHDNADTDRFIQEVVNTAVTEDMTRLTLPVLLKCKRHVTHDYLDKLCVDNLHVSNTLAVYITCKRYDIDTHVVNKLLEIIKNRDKETMPILVLCKDLKFTAEDTSLDILINMAKNVDLTTSKQGMHSPLLILMSHKSDVVARCLLHHYPTFIADMLALFRGADRDDTISYLVSIKDTRLVIQILDMMRAVEPDVLNWVNDNDRDITVGWHIFRYLNNLDLVKYMVESGANINCVDSWGWTPFHMACYYHSEEVIMYVAKCDVKHEKTIKHSRINDVSSDEPLNPLNLLHKRTDMPSDIKDRIFNQIIELISLSQTTVE